jgi:hypothetical protein
MPDIRTADAIAAIKQHVRDLAHPDNGPQGVQDVIDFWDANPGLYEAVHQQDPATGLTIMNPGPDATAMVDKYMRKTGAAAQDWVRGMQNPRANFRDAAIAAAGKWEDGVQRAINDKRFSKGMQGVDVNEAIATATSDGGSAYTAGVKKRQAKVTRVFGRLAPILGAVSQQVRQMPQDTPADREARMLRNLQLMRNVGNQLRGSGS